jgi:hypothetical protein
MKQLQVLGQNHDMAGGNMAGAGMAAGLLVDSTRCAVPASGAGHTSIVRPWQVSLIAAMPVIGAGHKAFPANGTRRLKEHST